MVSDIVLNTIWTGGVLLVCLLIQLIPLKMLSRLTKPFSWKTFGIRKIKRWHSRTDTLGNLMVWISALLCVTAPWGPYAPIWLSLWLSYTWLCTLSRAVRLGQGVVRWQKQTVIFLVNLLYGISLLGLLGVYSHYGLWIRAYLYAHEISTGAGLNWMYYLTNIQPAAYLLLVIISFWPMAVLWGQFKYMRLENTFKASNIYLYINKYTVLILVLLFLGSFGSAGLEKIYQLPPEERISSESRVLPLKEEDVPGHENHKASEQDSSVEEQGNFHPSQNAAPSKQASSSQPAE